MFKFFLTVGIFCIVISGVFIGAWTDGQQQRANFHSETTKHLSFRTKISLFTGLLGVISLGITGLIYFL